MKLKKFLRNLLLIPTLVFSLLGYPILASGAIAVYGFRGLTGADPALAGLDTTNIDDGSYAFGIDTSGYTYFYYLSKSSTATQSLPGVVAPNTGTGRWLLAPRVYADSFYSNSADLYHYTNISNSSAPSFTPSDGDMYVRRDTGIMYLYNQADNQHVPNLNSKIINIPTSAGSGSQTLFTRHMYGCTVTNAYANGEVTYVVPKAGYGMQFTIYLLAGYAVNIDPNSSDRIYPTCSANGDRLRNTGTVGAWVTLRSLYLPSDSDYNWYIFTNESYGTWADYN